MRVCPEGWLPCVRGAQRSHPFTTERICTRSSSARTPAETQSRCERKDRRRPRRTEKKPTVSCSHAIDAHTRLRVEAQAAAECRARSRCRKCALFVSTGMACGATDGARRQRRETTVAAAARGSGDSLALGRAVAALSEGQAPSFQRAARQQLRDQVSATALAAAAAAAAAAARGEGMGCKRRSHPVRVRGPLSWLCWWMCPPVRACARVGGRGAAEPQCQI